MTRAFESHTWVNHGDPEDGDVCCRDCGIDPGHGEAELPCPSQQGRMTDLATVVVVDDSDTVSVSEAGRRLGITRQAAYWLVWNKRIEAIQADGYGWRIPVAAIEARQAMPKDKAGQVIDRPRGRPKKTVDS